MSRHSVALLALVLGTLVHAADADDEQTLKNAGVGSDGPGLVAYFRKQMTPAAGADKIKKLVQQFNDADATTRGQAKESLERIGAEAVPFVRAGLRDADTEARGRLQKLLKELDKDPEDAVALAASRQLARSQPDGAAETLLAFLPLAGEGALADEIRDTLAVLAFREGQADKALRTALAHPEAEVRASVAEILARKGERYRHAIRQVLQDPDLGTRFRAAKVLAEQRDAEAVPVLIALLADLPAERASQAEQVLRDIAGGRAPAETTRGADRSKCRDAWSKWWTDFDDKALLDLYRRGTLTDALREQIQAVIKQLGHDDFETREKASARLMAMGAAVVSLLRQAQNDPDPEIQDRIKACLTRIEKDPIQSNPANSSRLVAVRKPAGAVEALLAYLPFALDENSLDEVQEALGVLALRDGKPERALVEALQSRLAVRRGVAAAALSRHAVGRHLPEVRRCLQDADPLVRLRLAQELSKHRVREAFGVLIDLYGELPRQRMWPIDELLARLAEGETPQGPLGDDLASRQRYRDAWSAWWREKGATVDLARLERTPRVLGYTLLVMPQNGRVMEIGSNGTPLWEITGLSNPMDAQVLPGGRVLIAEYQRRRVSERTFKNQVVWEKQLSGNPIACQRLANGNTFIVFRNQILEVDRTGKEVYLLNRPSRDLFAARRSRTGEIYCVSSSQRFVRLDAAGKELKSFGVGQVHSYVQFDLLPDGGVLMPQQGTNMVVEFDAAGKSRWEANVPGVFAAQRLTNGRTLLADNMNRVLEVDRAGKVVWEQKLPGPSWRAKRR